MQANAAKFNCSLIDVCRATSAAPTYLPSYEFHYTDRLGQDETLNCIDGGVYLNNPAMAAFVEVLSNPFYYRGVPTMNEKDIFILSIGTGKVAKNITAKSGKNWGEVKWAKNVIDAAMLGNSQTIEEQLYSILPGRYLRINLDIDPNFSDMDDSSEETMNYLLNEVFEKDFKSNGSWLTQLTAFKNLANL
jgi:patatin-like phospholipase/acyl hydrolase